MPAKRIERLGKSDEITRDEPSALMNELVERVLPIGSWLTPVNRTGIASDLLSVQRNVLSIALHRQLLEIGGKALQILLIRQHSHCLSVEKVVVPKRQQAHQHREIAFKRYRAEVFIHLVKATEHRTEVFRTDGNHGRKADGRIHRIATAHPIPEAEHVGGIDAELRDFGSIGRDRDKMLCDGLLVT